MLYSTKFENSLTTKESFFLDLFNVPVYSLKSVVPYKLRRHNALTSSSLSFFWLKVSMGNQKTSYRALDEAKVRFETTITWGRVGAGNKMMLTC